MCMRNPWEINIIALNYILFIGDNHRSLVQRGTLCMCGKSIASAIDYFSQYTEGTSAACGLTIVVISATYLHHSTSIYSCTFKNAI